MPKPLIAITQGDITGIGPETIVGVWSQPAMHELCRPIVIGHPKIIERAVALLKTGATVQVLDQIATAGRAALESALNAIEPSPKSIPCIPVGNDDVLAAKPATIDARGGQAAYDALVLAARLALDRKVDAIVTAPLHKAALWQAGHHYPGHTELLAELCGVNDFAMMLYLERENIQRLHLGATGSAIAAPAATSNAGLGVVHVTLHMALTDVFRNLTPEAVFAKAKLVDTTMTKLLGRRPRIGVCALNPHAGEEGLFGDEETCIIAPAIESAKKAGLTIDGPLPADTLMVRARDGQFDAVVAMYHDQGHIALKLLGMHRAVNITLGLPIVRTSVAHGTAFDLAWQGRAETSGMIEAIRAAARLVTR